MQSAVGRNTKVCYRQVAADHERCIASCERHEEVRPRLDTPASLLATLARRGRSSHIQAWGDRRCTSARMARHRIICLSCVHRTLKLLNDSIFVPPSRRLLVVPRFQLDTYGRRTSLSLDQRHGTCSKTICVSRSCCNCNN